MAEQQEPLQPFIYAPPAEPYLNVLHHDNDVLVISKPSGLLSVPGKGAHLADCAATRAQSRHPKATTVHRLDLDTSGVILMALNRAAHRHLSLQFEKRQISKTYIARVWGMMESDAGEIDAPLICDWPNRPRQIIDNELGREAFTEWQVIDRETNATRVQLMPRTGRSHQLRVHMASIGHPILGDNLYAHPEARGAANRLQLHAQALSFRHPTTSVEILIEDACPF